MNKILISIKKDLIELSDEKTRLGFNRFFKEPVKGYGVKSANVGKVSKKYWDEIKKLDKKAIFDLCEKLLKTDYCEDAFIAASWLPNITEKFEEADIKIFEKWLYLYINNWAKCDTFCNHTIGGFVEKFPKYISTLKTWAVSDNRWVKRASAVSLIVPAKKGYYLKDAFVISNILLKDTDDMVQKGYGWLLKEESRKHQMEVFNYVYKNRLDMPRTALRYAIELMPENMRKKAMSKNV